MRRMAVVVVAPLIALPLLAIGDEHEPKVGRAAWIAAVMAVYWSTECLPMAVTSLLPMVLFPMLGVVPADEISRNYFKDKIVLFFGGLVVACALEIVQLHRRVALRVLLLFGTRPRQLLLGFMAATSFISMWMSNTATTAMMMVWSARASAAAPSHTHWHTHTHMRMHTNMHMHTASMHRHAGDLLRERTYATRTRDLAHPHVTVTLPL